MVDSLSAIKYARVRTVRDESGLVVDYVPEGDFPRYGNDDDRADDIAVWLLKTFMTKIKKHHTYRNSEATTSILTITSNVVYGKATGALPDGRPAYTPFSPYRNSEATTSILTITSNVVYGKATGALPDGRPAYTPFSPGANPSYGAEKNGLLASLNSVAKLPYEYALDGISNTQTINPGALGTDESQRVSNLVNVLDGYFANGAPGQRA